MSGFALSEGEVDDRAALIWMDTGVTMETVMVSRFSISSFSQFLMTVNQESGTMAENQSFSWNERNMSERPSRSKFEQDAKAVSKRLQFLSENLVASSRVIIFHVMFSHIHRW